VHLRGSHGAAALDRLAAALLDRTRHETIRLAALRALRELEPATIAPILASLANDPNGLIRLEAGLSGGGAPGIAGDPVPYSRSPPTGNCRMIQRLSVTRWPSQSSRYRCRCC
jgi:hypothetical protein